MPSDLNALQEAFTQAVLWRDARALQGMLAGPIAQNIARLSVYANNHHLGLRECLAEVYPAVRQHMGEPAFEAQAREFVSANYQPSGNANDYGAGWAEFLNAQAHAELAELARLEWLRHSVLHAPELPSESWAEPQVRLDLPALLALDDQALACVHLEIAPSMRILTSAYPVLTLWQAIMADAALATKTELHPQTQPQQLPAAAEYCVVWRQDWQVEQQLIDVAQFIFLDALSKVSMLEALAFALTHDPDFELAAVLIRWRQQLICGQ